MRARLIINNEEAVGMGVEYPASDLEYEVGILLRSGYIEVESFEVIDDE